MEDVVDCDVNHRKYDFFSFTKMIVSKMRVFLVLRLGVIGFGAPDNSGLAMVVCGETNVGFTVEHDYGSR